MPRRPRVRVRKKRSVKTLMVVISMFLLLAVVLEAGVFAEHYFYRPYSPNYEKKDISSLLNKGALSQEDYNLLFEQTGLSSEAIDDFLKVGDKQSVLEIQNDFFGGYSANSSQFAPFTCYHYVDKNIKTAILKNGDIIVTPTTHFSIFRVGHSSLVVDGETEDTVTSTEYVTKSYIENISGLTDRPSFVILRPKDSEKAQAAAKYAQENLLDLQYSISVGVIGKKFPEKIKRTHCGHLVWYAYKSQGVDIDSNGGLVVLPSDIINSPELKIVQVFGMDVNEFKK